MNMKEKFLPIGTIVILKGGKRELMINSYCVIPNGEVYDKSGKVNAENQMYDYGACIYPEGMLSSDQTILFNHNQIERICFMGYITNQQQELSNILNEGLKEKNQS